MTEEIRFYRATGKYGFLSNLFDSLMIFEHNVFRNAEEAYQYGKPKDKEVADWLVSAPKPHLTAMAAHHALLSYDICEAWDDIKVDRMRRVLKAKFAHNIHIKQALLDTGDALLIEESKTDKFWGIGKTGKGENMLGKLLMEVRNDIRENPHEYR